MKNKSILKTSYFYSIALVAAQLTSRISKKSFLNHDIIKEIKTKGYCIIPAFLSTKICDDLIMIFDELEHAAESLDNDRRIFSIQKSSPYHNRIFADSAFLKTIGEYYVGTPQVLTTTMAGKIYAKPEAYGSGGGWHRDSFLPQFKALCYLSDVSETNGPFEYITGSHKLFNKILFESRSKTREQANNPRYTQESINEYLEIMNVSSKTFVAKKEQ